MVARVPLFAAMDESEIAEITKLLYTRTYLPGVPMVRTGDAGDAMFLIASGEAVADIGHGRHVLLKEGDFFGEMGLLERRRHKHDVVAKTRCRVYLLDAKSLSRLARRHPEILRRIRNVAEARAIADQAARNAGRKRKTRDASASRSKHDEPETL
jgi:voltage-gated potassium channel